MKVRFLVLVTALAGMGLPRAAAAGDADGLWVVRFDGRITDPVRERVAETGLRILDYEPHDSYIAIGSHAAAEGASRLGGIASVAPLPAERKLDPRLVGADGDLRIDVTAYGPALGAVRAEGDALGRILGSYEASADGRLAGVGMVVPAASLPDIVSNPAVLYVQPAADRIVPEDEATAQIQAGNINASSRPVPGYPEWLASRNLDGSGVKVTVVDTGIDPHPDLLGRVTRLQNYASPAETVDLFGHGTHVAGIIGGNPPGGALPADPDGFTLGTGVAPGVEMLDINPVGFTGDFPPASFEGYTSSSYAWGSRMWNASWTTGGGAGVGYTARARHMDELSRNAVFATPGMEEFLMVFSAGNSGGSGLTEPKEAKNMITVAASASGRGLRWPLTTNINSIASFSSRGPAKDGRIAPTISAPGENVISARAAAAAGLVLGACVSDTFSPIHAPCSGTSMAAPHVAGAAALVHQWWKRETGAVPSPAMVKALLVNGATDMGSKNIPNRDEGWGRVNVGAVVGAMPDVHEDQGIVFGGPGEERSYVVEVPAGGAPFKTTVAWSDAPGAAGAKPALVNDLDLVVERLGPDGQVVQRWLGNRFSLGQSTTTGARDALNNLENVYLNTPVAGTYRVTIRAANVPGDGIPGNEDPTDQDFALVLRGARPGVSDELYALQWGLRLVNAPAAWQVSTGEGTRVGIIGDGVDFEHPDLAGKVVGGTAFMGCSANPSGCGTGHWKDNTVNPGTHETVIAGIVAANTDNGFGVAGVAPDADILAVNISRPGELGYWNADALAATRWAIDHGADVLNLSFGGGPFLETLIGGDGVSSWDAVIKHARQRDVVVVSSAGNLPVMGCGEPASVQGVLCVTGVGPLGAPAWYSAKALPEGTEVVAAPAGQGSANGGAACDIDVVGPVAPVGNELYCTGPYPGYGFGAGTSFAAPHAAGVAALLASQCRSAAEIVRVMQETARNPVTGARGQWDPVYGYGLIDAAAAVATPVQQRRAAPRPGLASDPCFPA